MTMISRAQFLRGDWRGDKPTLYPPWSWTAVRFTAACDGCGDCVKACSQNILQLSARGLPQVNFAQGACTFCRDCVAACPSGALHQDNSRKPWQLTASISRQCLAVNGTSCVRCVENCAVEAIMSRPALRGRVKLSIDETACTGCGACFATCPVKAISIQPARFRGTQRSQQPGEHNESFMHQ